MEKWECDVCGYIYDPAEGDSEAGIAPGTSLKSSPMTGSARFAAWAKINSLSWTNIA